MDKILKDHCVIQTNSWAGAVSNHSEKPCYPQGLNVLSQGSLDKSRLVQHPIVPGGWVVVCMRAEITV